MEPIKQRPSRTRENSCESSDDEIANLTGELKKNAGLAEQLDVAQASQTPISEHCITMRQASLSLEAKMSGVTMTDSNEMVSGEAVYAMASHGGEDSLEIDGREEKNCPRETSKRAAAKMFHVECLPGFACSQSSEGASPPVISEPINILSRKRKDRRDSQEDEDVKRFRPKPRRADMQLSIHEARQILAPFFKPLQSIMHERDVSVEKVDQVCLASLLETVATDHHDKLIEIFQLKDEEGWNVFHALAFLGWNNVIDKLIECVMDVAMVTNCINAPCEESRDMPIHLAAIMGFEDTIKRLISHGARLTARNSRLENVLFKVVGYCYKNHDVSFLQNFLSYCSGSERPEVVGVINDLLSSRNDIGLNVLGYASSESYRSHSLRRDVVTALLEYGAIMDIVDSKSGISILHMAAINRDKELFKWVVDFFMVQNKTRITLGKLIGRQNGSRFTVHDIIQSNLEHYDGEIVALREQKKGTLVSGKRNDLDVFLLKQYQEKRDSFKCMESLLETTITQLGSDGVEVSVLGDHEETSDESGDDN